MEKCEKRFPMTKHVKTCL
uniref:Uncharacterized protein n=1 Tax=Anguilla anguilla TaxID=7936 RepID=A0A0E9PFK6_ANGAN